MTRNIAGRIREVLQPRSVFIFGKFLRFLVDIRVTRFPKNGLGDSPRHVEPENTAVFARRFPAMSERRPRGIEANSTCSECDEAVAPLCCAMTPPDQSSYLLVSRSCRSCCSSVSSWTSHESDFTLSADFEFVEVSPGVSLAVPDPPKANNVTPVVETSDDWFTDARVMPGMHARQVYAEQ